MDIRLLVIRTADTKGLADFYSLFGLSFEYHKHGNSPLHYSASFGNTVLEIYPLTKSQSVADKNLRLGFGIDNFDQTITNLNDLKVPFSLEPVQTEFGFMAIVSDPDGRKIELYKRDSKNTLDKFGKFIVENLRDKGIDFAENLLRRHWKAPGLLEIQDEMANLSDVQKASFIKAVTKVVDGAMHDFLFALQDQADYENDIQILVDGQNIVTLSDGIHGEAYSDEGWFAKFSRYKGEI